jgi:hypothetical protein
VLNKSFLVAYVPVLLLATTECTVNNRLMYSFVPIACQSWVVINTQSGTMTKFIYQLRYEQTL